MKKTVIILSILAFIASGCGQATKQENIPQIENTSQIEEEVIFKYDTLLVNGLQLITTSNEDTTQFYCLTAINGDTIIPFADYYFRIKFLDIDEDGYTDIRVSVFSNTPNQCDNYLFDSQHKIFRVIENCDIDIKKIKGTDFYYSYNATGCADLDWESYLSKINNFQLVEYGHISGQGCDDRLVINIYKIVKEEEFLIEKLPYKKYIPKFEDKWDFIENYWKTNYRNFE